MANDIAIWQGVVAGVAADKVTAGPGVSQSSGVAPAPPTPPSSDDVILWDDLTDILWDDGSKILWG